MSGRLPSLEARDVIRAFELRHGEKVHLRVTVPYHTGELKRGLVFAIVKQADLTPDEFIQLL